MNLLFHGLKYTIKIGCLPFGVIPSKMMTPNSRTLLSTIMNNNNNLESYVESVHGLIKTELDFLKSIKTHVPTHYEEFKIQIEQYDLFLGAFLGTGHAVYGEYRKAYKLVVKKWMFYIRQFDVGYGNAKVGPMLIVWFFHF